MKSVESFFFFLTINGKYHFMEQYHVLEDDLTYPLN